MRTTMTAALVAMMCVGALSASAAKKPNVLFILTDQWRAHATGYAGDPYAKTPNLEGLATQGIDGGSLGIQRAPAAQDRNQECKGKEAEEG